MLVKDHSSWWWLLQRRRKPPFAAQVLSDRWRSMITRCCGAFPGMPPEVVRGLNGGSDDSKSHAAGPVLFWSSGAPICYANVCASNELLSNERLYGEPDLNPAFIQGFHSFVSQGEETIFLKYRHPSILHFLC